MPGAAAQAREFLVKQAMMQRLVAFRSMLQDLRYKAEPGTEFFLACNTLIKEVEDRIFKVNAKAMPKDCEEFDLFEEFITQVFALVHQLNDKNVRLKNDILDRLRSITGFEKRGDYAPFIAQQEISKFLYTLLEDYVGRELFIHRDTKAMELTDEQDEMLEDLLPLLAYLNSEHNPFGRNGLFGKLIDNPFHNEALEAYKSHERKAECKLDFVTSLKMPAPRPQGVEYSGAQMSALLFGSKPTGKKATTSGFIGFFVGLLTEASAGSRDTVQSDSEQRRELLALPMPPQYQAVLAIEWNPAPRPSSEAPKPSESPRKAF